MARKGAAVVRHAPDPDGPSASEVWRETVARSGPAPVWEPDEVWVVDDETPVPAGDGRSPRPGDGRSPRSGDARFPRPGDARSPRPGDARSPRPGDERFRQGPAPTEERDQAVGDTSAAGGHRHSVPAPVVSELTDVAGTQRGVRLAARLADATHAYDRERFGEARKILRPLAEEVPEAKAVRELYGLTLYRLGDWVGAARQLEAYRSATGAFDQHPVLADCYRALRRYADADDLWDELREASPDGDLVAEGRIVAAGCRADQGDLAGAIAVLEKVARRVEHPKDRHLRQWYTLADLYERAGDLPRAREMFARILRAEPDAFDVSARLRGLR